MKELNPNHPVTQAAHDHWHKLCALVMAKLGATSVEITPTDIADLELTPGGANIVCHDKGDRLILRLVTDAEADKLAREAGGLPA